MRRLDLYVSSRTGHVRDNNEDIVLAGAGTYRDTEWRGTGIVLSESDHFVAAVCDGMGGLNAGEVASEDVATQLRAFVADLPQALPTDELHERLTQWAHDESEYLVERGHDDHTLSGMGTTLVGWLYYEGRVLWFNCGDSRLYRFRQGELTQLTRDHNLYQITRRPEDSHILVNCIGAGGIEPVIDFADITPDHQRGDAYLLCSDGLVDMLSDDDIRHIMTQGGTARELVAAALDAGGVDNVSVCMVELY